VKPLSTTTETSGGTHGRQMAENTLAPHDQGVPWMSLMARDWSFTPCAAADLSRPSHKRLHRDRRAHAGRRGSIVRNTAAIEAFTLELPAGLVDHDEDPAEGCRLEFLKRPGSCTRHHPLAKPPMHGRLNNRIHSFFVKRVERVLRSSRAGPDREAGGPCRTRTHDQGRESFATPYRSAPAGRAAWLPVLPRKSAVEPEARARPGRVLPGSRPK